MPFNAGSSRRFLVSSFNGDAVSISAGSVLFVADLPKLTTHVSIIVPTGAAECVYSAYQMPGAAGVAVVPSSASLVLTSGKWYTIPILNLDRPQFGFAIHADDVVLHGGTPLIRISPEIDPIVAVLRARCRCAT
jgi:hypothetical protein